MLLLVETPGWLIRGKPLSLHKQLSWTVLELSFNNSASSRASSNINIIEADPHCVFLFGSNNKTPKPQTPPPPPKKKKSKEFHSSYAEFEESEMLQLCPNLYVTSLFPRGVNNLPHSKVLRTSENPSWIKFLFLFFVIWIQFSISQKWGKNPFFSISRRTLKKGT